MAGFGFSVEEVETSSFDPFPKGAYKLKATEGEIKDTAAKTGKYLAVTFEVTKGEYAGRKIWQNFNIHNPNEKAEKIGREQVAGWARACGKPNARDSDELLEREFEANVDIEKGTGGYSDKNIIKSFLIPGDKKPAASSDKPKGKFDDEPAPKKEEKREEPKEEKREEPKEEPKREESSSNKKKNPWD